MDGKDCSRQSVCISTIHGGHSNGREHGAEALPTWKAMTVPGHRLAYTSSLGIAAN